MSEQDYLLFDEERISDERLMLRRSIASQLASLPIDFFENLKILQTDVGCGNVCAMCSQSVASEVTALTIHSMEDFLAGLKYAIHNREDLREVISEKSASGAPLIAWKRKGKVVPYLDNDAMSSNDLLERFIHIMKEDFNCTVQLSTVGYSRHNPVLDAMHKRIADPNNGLLDAISELRFSWSHYPFGARRVAGDRGDEYWQDASNMLATYLPLYNQGVQNDRFKIELRYPPDIDACDVEEQVHANHHIIKCGAHLFIQLEPNADPLPISSYGPAAGEDYRHELYENPDLVTTIYPRNYISITADALREHSLDDVVKHIAFNGYRADVSALRLMLESKGAFKETEVGLSKWKNAGGVYYAADPFRNLSTNEHLGLHIYPATQEGDYGVEIPRKKKGLS